MPRSPGIPLEEDMSSAEWRAFVTQTNDWRSNYLKKDKPEDLLKLARLAGSVLQCYGFDTSSSLTPSGRETTIVPIEILPSEQSE